VFLAAIDGVAVGFVQLFATASTVQLGTGYILEDLFVVPEARRGGVAGALIERALNHAHENGAVGMFLETASDNAPAQALYERLGWTREGRFLKYNAPL
jgi:ribosomal protein S18 acetylase RimI-like enzyme